MRVEMISTGEEVLSGQIVDTNAAWFADTLMNQGIELQRRSTVGDRLADLVGLFTERSREADAILVNGGLGPTSDDLSAEAAARALGVELIEDQEWRTHLEDWFHRRGRTMPASNLKQCLLPAGAVRIDNPNGSAPGFRVNLNGCWLFFTPGVPSEFKPMVQDHFLPFLATTFGRGTETRLHKLLTLGHGESSLADRLGGLPVPAGITLGYRPSMPIVEIKLFARGNEAIGALPAFVETVRATLGTAVVADNSPSLADTVHTLLASSGLTLAIAESCTGGMLTSSLVDFAGSSAYLQQGLVTYANAAKQQVLGVRESTLAEHGAVSVATAREMAEGARALLDCDFALSTTGVAGPDGGTEDKPVGRVCIGLASRTETVVQTVQLSRRSRDGVRTLTCAIALDMLRRQVVGEDPVVDYPFVPRVDASRFPAG